MSAEPTICLKLANGGELWLHPHSEGYDVACVLMSSLQITHAETAKVTAERDAALAELAELRNVVGWAAFVALDALTNGGTVEVVAAQLHKVQDAALAPSA